jgi:hypothetical protein
MELNQASIKDMPIVTVEQIVRFREAAIKLEQEVQALNEKMLMRDCEVASMASHFCNAVDNLNDMPVSDQWAANWAQKGVEILEKNNYFKTSDTLKTHDTELLNKAAEIVSLTSEETACQIAANKLCHHAEIGIE